MRHEPGGRKNKIHSWKSTACVQRTAVAAVNEKPTEQFIAGGGPQVLKVSRKGHEP